MLAKSKPYLSDIPECGQNNIWFKYDESDSALIFIHGIFSCSRTSWLNTNRILFASPSYWPQIVADDGRFANLSIFLGGYYTSVVSGNYGIRDCVDELLSGLKQKGDMHAAPIERDNIIFVCHSLGGVVARSLLERHSYIFKDKNVALVLIASPSFGAHVVDTLSALIDLYTNKQALALKWNSEIISDLDDRFKDLKESGIIRKLRGIEFYENKFIFKSCFAQIFNKSLVVPRESAGRYFGSPKQIPNSDHFSICKPCSKGDVVHRYLHDFLYDEGFIPAQKK